MAEGDAALEAAVAAFLGDIGVANPDRLLATLRDDHARPETPYHSWSHILHGLGLLWEYRDLIPEFDAVVLAWLNHDRIYDAQRSDNEERSAELGRTMCAEQGRAELSDRVAELILDTQHQAEPATPAGAWLVGIDLAILGETPERYAAFEENIRTEYAHVPRPLYRMGRGRILRGFLKREEIYKVPELRERFEAQARANLKQALDCLN